MANSVEQVCKHLQLLRSGALSVEKSILRQINDLRLPLVWRGNCDYTGQEVAKAFGGVLNGLDGNFGPKIRDKR